MDIEAKLIVDGSNIESYLNQKINQALDSSSAYETIAEDVMDRLEWRTIDEVDQELEWDRRVMEVIDDNISSIASNVCDDIDWQYQISNCVDWEDIVTNNMPDFSLEYELRGLMDTYSPYNLCETGRLATDVIRSAVIYLISTDDEFRSSLKDSLNEVQTPDSEIIATNNIEETNPTINLNKQEIEEIISISTSVVRARNGINFDNDSAFTSIVRLLPEKIRNLITSNS